MNVLSAQGQSEQSHVRYLVGVLITCEDDMRIRRQYGDTLTLIARQTGSTVATLVTTNCLIDLD